MTENSDPKANCEIRPAQPGDEGVIADLIRALSVYEKMEDQCVVTPEGIRAHIFGERPAAQVLIAWMGSEAVAFALYFTNFSTFLAKPGLYLEDLFVKPEYRRYGIGTKLLKELARIALQRGYGRMEWSVLEWNELAKDRYRKIGAVPLEDWRIWRMTVPVLREFLKT